MYWPFDRPDSIFTCSEQASEPSTGPVFSGICFAPYSARKAPLPINCFANLHREK